MKKLFLLLNLSILCLFSSFSWSAGTEVEAGQQKLVGDFNFPDYSPLGQRIANGEYVKAKVFYWIKADGTIGSTKRGWSRVPKSSRHLVYLDKNNAEQAIQDASQAIQDASMSTYTGIEATKDFFGPNCLSGGLRNCGSRNACSNGTKPFFTYPVCVMEFCSGYKYEYAHTGGTIDDGLGSCHGYVWDRYKYIPTGDQYVGEFKKKKQHGQGTYTWASGDQYKGGIKEGKPHGQGTYTWPSGNKHIGQWRYGQRHGHGITTYADGTIEEGFWQYDYLTALTGPACSGSYSAFSWHNCIGWRPIDSINGHIGWYQNGQAHGEGSSIYNQGKKDERYYEGNFKNGEAHGQGSAIYKFNETFKKRPKYVGEWKDNKKHGQGTFTWPNGDKYVGEWKDDERNGQGTVTWVSGANFVGQWRNNQRHGHGTKTNVDGPTYEGEYANGEILKGTKTWANGNKYVGEIKDSRSHGVGNFYRTDGSMMGGIWKNDEPVEGYSGYKCSGDSASWSDCIGTLTLADGTQFIGKFLDGKTSGKGTLIFSDNRPMQFAFEPSEQELVVLNYKGPAIGDIVKTKYFEVTVNSASFQDWVGDFNFPVYPGPGNKFLVIDVTYVNSDNEARVLMGGEVVVRVDDKEFLFDTAEVVFADGYILFDTLNPMVTRKGNVVFKVSEHLKEGVFYKPARSSELIKIK